MSAIDDIAAERQRQLSAEGWTLDHDDCHHAGEMARAAAAYAIKGSVPEGRDYQIDVSGHAFHGKHKTFRVGWFTPTAMLWPWAVEWWKPSDPRRNLVKAGALIVAEIERLDRLAAKGK